MSVTLTERSLYPVISNCLSKLGFTSVQEINLGGEFLDIEGFYQSEKFIIEVKIGRWEDKLIEGILKAKDYAQKAETENVLVIVYPSEIRRPLFPERIEEIVLKSKIDALVITKYWKESFTREKRVTVELLLEQLHDKVDRRETEVSLELIIETIRDAITLLSEHLRSLSALERDKLINTVIGKFDLFLALGESAGSKEKELSIVSIDLASYLLVNQILFYHIYNRLSGNVPPLQEVKSVTDLKSYFNKITEINYKSIYSVDIIVQLPLTPKVNALVGKVVAAIMVISPENVKHDLLGRLFHELLPPTTRKILAAFYTRPVAAEILSTLAIDSSQDKVFDPACGSGTLLVSAYRRKIELLNAKSTLEKIRAHTQFVENQITGLDIMPFAAHLTAIHLSSQNFEATTDKLRIGVKDSLKSRPSTEVDSFSKLYQTTLLGEGGTTIGSGAITPEGEGEGFALEMADVVMMNPPFTKMKRLPLHYRKQLSSSAKDLEKISGKSSGLWGYFMALSTKFSTKTMAYVIPINLLRGKGSMKLRERLLNKQFKWKYLIKSTENYGFSEKSEYRDILLVIEKGHPSLDDKLCIVLLKRPLESFSLTESKQTALEILKAKPDLEVTNPDFQLYWVDHKTLFANKRHLMPFVAFNKLENQKLALKLIGELLQRSGSKLTKPRKDWFFEGFRPVPMGLSQVVFVTKPFHKSRTEEAFMILANEDEKTIQAHISDLNEEVYIEKEKTMPSLRTLTGISRFNITNLLDYVVINPYPKASKIIELSKLKEKSIDWDNVKTSLEKTRTYISVASRINWYSPNVSLLAFYSDIPYSPSNIVEVIKINDPIHCKIHVLNMNSTIFLLQLFMHKEETTGRYLHLRVEDLIQCYLLNPLKLTNNEKDSLLTLFEELKDVDLPSIRQQLKEKHPARIKLDTCIMKIIGFTVKEIGQILPKLYDMLYEEMMQIKRLRKD